jgi:hypothetical protein
VFSRLVTGGLKAVLRVSITLLALFGVTVDDGFDKLPLKVLFNDR